MNISRTETKLYMAPMEGLTGYVYRNAYHKYFHGIDRYFTPFIASRGLNHREKQDILPEHNQGMEVVPQILTNQADVFLEIAKRLWEYGYREVNLNLGCPSGTVTAKGRGAGFLADPERLREFLVRIFEQCPMRISIKTRIGVKTPEEWPGLMSVFHCFPVSELIIHPRVQKDFYRNTPRREAFAKAVQYGFSELCYNGDINTAAAYEELKNEFPTLDRLMLGRGLLANPTLAEEIKGERGISRDALEGFLEELLAGYCREMSGDRNVLFKMKELWIYLGKSFEHPEKYLKQMKKADTVQEYTCIVKTILRNCDMKQLT